MTLATIMLVLLGVAGGPLLAGVRRVVLRRLLGWMLLLACAVAAHVFLLGADPIARMVGICCVLLGAMKGLVYAEWASGRSLPFLRYLVFSFAWFGMDPGTFQVRREGLSWKGDLGGGLC